jgi:hypothetical protein
MKAISIRPPWAWAIIYAGKDVENRTWKTKTRGLVAIHASKNMNRTYYESASAEISKLSRGASPPSYEAMVTGAIIGIVEVVACEERSKSKWHHRNSYGFVLKNPRILRKPIHCNGALGFWEVPKAIVRRMSAQLKRRH